MLPEQRIEELRKEIGQLEVRAKEVARLREKYPDLKEHTNRWGTVRYSSKLVNETATDVDVHHTCGCCSDAGCIVWPYLKDGDSTVYADESVCVGDRNNWGWDWKKRLREKYPEYVVEMVTKSYYAPDEDENDGEDE